MAKCDFCSKEATSYGSQQCYFVCDDHVAEGEAVENAMFAEMERVEDELRRRECDL